MGRIELRDVHKSFGGVEAVKGVTTELRDGCLTVLVGPSGSGKTTLLRAIAGLERITSGEILIDGRDVTDLPPRDRDAAFVFQNYALYAHMTVRDNIAFPLRARKVPKAERRQAAADVARRLGLEPLLGRKPTELSGGQQQRVAIGRAIIRQPAVFLFDEPLSNLDAQLRVELRQEILRMRETLRVTAVWVTHDQEEAMAMGDEIIVIDEGKVAQQASPDLLYTRPASIYVAKTIGSPTMNLYPGRAEKGVFSGPFEANLHGDLDSAKVTLGVRPEDVHLCDEVPAERSIGRLVAQVELVELLGPRAIVSMRVGEAPITGVFERRQMVGIREHESIEISADVDALHLFDSGTEARLCGHDSVSESPALRE
ncbi:MAG: ABC transporter ATP-binding protein [Solirubrobacterales bacterium]